MLRPINQSKYSFQHLFRVYPIFVLYLKKITFSPSHFYNLMLCIIFLYHCFSVYLYLFILTWYTHLVHMQYVLVSSLFDASYEAYVSYECSFLTYFSAVRLDFQAIRTLRNISRITLNKICRPDGFNL